MANEILQKKPRLHDAQLNWGHPPTFWPHMVLQPGEGMHSVMVNLDEIFDPGHDQRHPGPRPTRFLWRVSARWNAFPTAGGTLDIYYRTGDVPPTGNAAHPAFYDGSSLVDEGYLFTDPLELANYRPLRSLVVERTAHDHLYTVSGGPIKIPNRYFAFAIFNSADTALGTPSASLIAVADEIQ